MGAAGHTIVLRYHEIALKGRNRPFFVRRLVENVERATAGLPVGPVRRASARLLLPLADRAAWPAVRDRLARVFGIVNFALAHELAIDTRAGDAPAQVARLGEAIVARLRESLAGDATPEQQERRALAAELMPHVEAFYRGWRMSERHPASMYNSTT